DRRRDRHARHAGARLGKRHQAAREPHEQRRPWLFRGAPRFGRHRPDAHQCQRLSCDPSDWRARTVALRNATRMDLTDVRFAQPDKERLLHDLRAIVPEHAVLSKREELAPYECDGLPVYRNLPLAVVLPDTEQQVAAVLKICRRLNVPLVARGAGTGLSGGAVPRAQGIVLSLAKFNRILAIDPLARTARVQPGVRNLAISEAAKAHGLYYAPDPSSQIARTIGGNAAKNSGGGP